MRSLLKNLALVLFSLILTLGMLEVAARIFKLGTGGFWEPHPEYGWRNIPNASGWESCYGECQVKVTINSLGLRDVEFDYEKPADTQRILFLGDSITAGMQVPLADTFVKQLEQQLVELNGVGDWQVLNGAVNGFGTDNELLFYRLEGAKYDPDIVVLGVYLANDIYNNSRVLEAAIGGEDHKPYYTLDENGELQLHNFPVADTQTFSNKIGTFFKKYFQLPRFVAQTLSLRGEVPAWARPIVQIFAGNRGVVDDDAANEDSQTNEETEADAGANAPAATTQRFTATICDTEYTPDIQDAWNVTKALIRQLRTEVEANGARLAVVSIPTTAQTITPKGNADWYCVQPNQELNSFLEAEEIPYVDLLEPFRAYSPNGGAALYYRRDFHMNELGHQLAGAELTEFIQQQFLVDEPPTAN